MKWPFSICLNHQQEYQSLKFKKGGSPRVRIKLSKRRNWHFVENFVLHTHWIPQVKCFPRQARYSTVYKYTRAKIQIFAWHVLLQIVYRQKTYHYSFMTSHSLRIRELKQPRRRRQQKPHKFAYLTMKNSIFARFARAFFIFWHFEDVLVLSTTWNDLFCSCVDDESIYDDKSSILSSYVPSACSNLIPG